jgi:hypothetical protein
MSISVEGYQAACRAYSDVTGRYVLNTSAMDKALHAYEDAKPKPKIPEDCKKEFCVYHNISIWEDDSQLNPHILTMWMNWSIAWKIQAESYEDDLLKSHLFSSKSDIVKLRKLIQNLHQHYNPGADEFDIESAISVMVIGEKNED